MKHFLLTLFLGFIITCANAQNDFRTRQDGNWEDANTWEEFNGSAWQNTANIPNVDAGAISIESFHVVTITADLTVDQLLVKQDAFLTVTSDATVTLEDGASDDLIVTVGNGSTIFDGYFTLEEGTKLINKGSIVSSKLNFAISGTYEHARDGGAIALAGWATESVLLISGIQNVPPTQLGGPFKTFIWDNPAQAIAIPISNELTTVSKDLIIQNTNAQLLVLYSGVTPSTLAVGNDFIINSGATVVLSNSSTLTMTVDGQLNNQGNIILSDAAGTTSLSVKSDFTSTGAISTGTPASIEFAGTNQTATISGTTGGEIAYKTKTNTILSLNESVLGGSGFLETGSNSTLKVASIDPNGALQSTAGGNIQVPVANRTYAAGTKIIYNGAARQYIGDAHPSTVPVIIENNMGVALAADLDLDADLALNNGALYLEDHDLTLRKNLTAAGGFYIYPTDNSSVHLLGGGTINTIPFPPNAQTLNSLTLDRTGSGNNKIPTDLTVKGNLTLEKGTLDISNRSLTIEGDLITATGKLRTNAQSSLLIKGNGSFAGVPFADATSQLKALTLSRSGATFTPSQDLVIFELLELTNGTLDNTGDHILLLNGSEIIRHSNGQITGAHPGLFAGTYDLTYRGGSMTAGPELPGAGANELGNLLIEGGPVTITNDLIINGNVTFTSGGIFAPNVNFNMKGATWSQGLGTFSNENGQVVFETSTTVSATDFATFHTITLTSPANVQFDALQVAGDINLNPASTVSFNELVMLNGTGDQDLNFQGKEINDITMAKSSGETNLTSILRLKGDLIFAFPSTINSNGRLIVKAGTDAYNGGSIQIIPPGAAIVGDVTVERLQKNVTPTGIQVYLGIALSDAIVGEWQDDFPITGSFTGASSGGTEPSLHYYDETQPGDQFTGWAIHPTTANTELLTPGIGYRALVKGSGDLIIDAAGTINQGQQIVPVSKTDNGMPGADGWNLIANPYPASIGWDQLGGWDKASVNNTIVMEVDGKFKYWNGTGAGNNSRIVVSNGVIPAGHTFWVQAHTTGNLLIEESAKISAASPPVFADPSDQLIIALDNGIDFDETVLVVWPDATAGYDPDLDAVKLDNAGFDLSTQADDGTPLALNYLAPFGCQAEITLRIDDVTSGSYTLNFSEMTSFSSPYTITLHDNFLDADIDVRTQSAYSFTIDDAQTATFTNRFSISFDLPLAVLVDTSIDLQSSELICPNTDATVIMNSSQPGIVYQSYLNNEIYGATFEGTGQTVIIDIAAADLNNQNTFKITASAPACGGTIDLLETLSINKNNIVPQIVESNGMLISNYASGNEWFLDGLSISTSDRITPSEEGEYTLTVTQGSCQASATKDFTIVAGVDEVFSNSIQISPNPTTGSVTIHLPDYVQADIQLISLSGRILLSQKLDLNNPKINLSEFNTGIYLLKIITEDKVGVKRIMKH